MASPTAPDTATPRPADPGPTGGPPQESDGIEAGEAPAFDPIDVLEDPVGAFHSFAAPVVANWQSYAVGLGILVLAVGIGLMLSWLISRGLRALVVRAGDRRIGRVVDRLRGPIRPVGPWIMLLVVLPSLQSLAPALVGFARHLVSLFLIASIAWTLLVAMREVERFMLNKHRVDVDDNLVARRMHTQLRFITRTLAVIIVVLGASAALMTFDGVRQVGTSLLASAGVAGLVIGLAARPAVENIISGLQISLAQPIRIDDVVVIDGEWGRVEEITATYVVVRIWDERRQIVPFSRIIGESFTNWTRSSSQILGWAMIYTDYTAPVDELRRVLRETCEKSPHWDKRVCGLQVTDATEHTMAIRALVSARDAGKAWDLRCEVREALIVFLQREHPESLPKTRVRIEGGTPSNLRDGFAPAGAEGVP